jgi:hypothetical protein
MTPSFRVSDEIGHQIRQLVKSVSLLTRSITTLPCMERGIPPPPLVSIYRTAFALGILDQTTGVQFLASSVLGPYIDTFLLQCGRIGFTTEKP